MPFLYGDSTPSTLETNYIDFLRDALDFSAQVLGADERRRGSSARADELRRATEIEVARLESFGDAVSRAVVAAMSAAGRRRLARHAVRAVGHALLVRAS